MNEYREPSQTASIYQKHIAAMKPGEDLPVGKSFAIPLEDYSFGFLKDIAETMNVNDRCIVVVYWPASFEVQRLPDGSNSKLFYKHCKLNLDTFDNSIEKTKEKLAQYIKLAFEDCLTVYPSLKKEAKRLNIISYTHLQRSLGPLASFRKAKEGPKERLHRVIEQLEKDDVLRMIPENKALDCYQTRAKLYQIDKSKLTS